MADQWIGWVTLYTDANPDGWGAYARAHEGLEVIGGGGPRVESRGAFESSLDSTAAECRAIIEGCRMVLGYWRGVDGIGVRTDSQAAILVLKHRAPPHRRPDLRQAQADLMEILGNVRHRLQWVKGHRHPSSSRQAWLNDRVDRHAAAARSGS